DEARVVNRDARVPDDRPVRPRGKIRGIEGVVPSGQTFARGLIAAAVEEVGADGVARPGEAGRRIHETGDLEPGVEDVLVGRALGPEAAAAHRRAGERDAGLPVVLESAR